MTTETTPLVQDAHPLSDNSQPQLSGSESRRPLPFVRCVVLCGFLTFLGSLTFANNSVIVNQYVFSRLLEKYNINTTMDRGAACTANSSNASDDGPATRVQEETSSFMLLLAITGHVPAIFVNVILGSCSDFLGRRMLFFVPFFGFLLKNICTLCIMYYESDINYFYLASTLDALGGSFPAFLVACFAYTADITSTGTARIMAASAVEVCIAVASAVGQLLLGYLIALVGYVTLGVVMTSTVLGGCLLVLVLPETAQRRPMTNCSPFVHFKNAFGYYTTNEKRVLYNVVLVIFLCMVFPTLGRVGIDTLYSLGRPFCLDSIQIGYFGALRITMSNIGSISAIKLLHRCINYEVIALIGSIDSIIAFVLQGLATNTTTLFLVPVVSLVSTTAIGIARGTISRMTSPREQGAVFSGIAVFETSVSMLSQVLLNWVYSSTVARSKGAVFFLMAAFGGVASLMILVWIRISPKYRDVYTIDVYETREEETVSFSTSSR